jgi:hypothetical protein
MCLFSRDNTIFNIFLNIFFHLKNNKLLYFRNFFNDFNIKNIKYKKIF